MIARKRWSVFSAVAFLAIMLAVGSCGGDSLAWEYRFEPLTLRDDARVIEARVLLGGCSGDELAAYRFAPGERSAVAPAPLEAGRYGLEIEARDATCRWYARGCTELEVPTSEAAVQVVVTSIATRDDCPATCSDGLCGGE